MKRKFFVIALSILVFFVLFYHAMNKLYFSERRLKNADMVATYQLKYGCLDKVVVRDTERRLLFAFKYDWGEVPFFKIYSCYLYVPSEKWLAPCKGFNNDFRIHTIRIKEFLIVEVREDCRSEIKKRYVLSEGDPDLELQLNGEKWIISYLEPF